MREKHFYLLIAVIILGFVPVHAQTIIWVSEWNSDANGVPYDHDWIDLLKAQGYTVTADTSGTYEVLNTAKITALDAADLVIFSRNTNSNRYIDGGEITQWNLINTPLMLMNPYLAQSSRWQWINSALIIEFTNESMMDVIDSSHQIFDGITTANNQVDVIDNTVNNGQTTFITSGTVGNGTVLAKRTGSSYVWIAEWKPGIQFYSETSQKPSEKRMLFTAGGSAGQQSGAMNLTEDGKQIFLNTVLYMLGSAANQNIAGRPRPENLKQGVSYKTDLSWNPGFYADTHNVYLGTDLNDVNNATIDSHDGVTLTEGLDVNNLDPGTLNFGATYYWRVDEVNAPSRPYIYKGTTWSFTVEPAALKLPKEYITVSARNNAAKNDPNNTINEVGLDPNNMDQHSKSSGMWLSGTVSAADPAWIRYDFDQLYKIHEMLVWNYNSKLLLNSGFRQVLVEYSADGLSWTPITSVTEFAKGSGNSGYIYNTLVSFNDTAVKSVRITAMSNWGTTYKNGGLSEIRFTYIPTRARISSPEMDEADAAIDSALSWRPGREAVNHDVYISTDKQVIINGTAPAHTVSVNTYLPLLDLGRTYYWSVTEVNNAATPKRWESDIWSFSTIEYASIDDFEDYNGTDGYYIWQTWDDGASNPSNGGSQIGYINNPFVETKIAEHGKQSAPVYYDNSASSNVSEVSRTFAAALNWQVNGADTLRLYYRGNAITFAEPSPGVIAMSAEGADIIGNADEFRYAYKTLTGNGSITVRVDSIQNTNAWSKAGVMIRNTLDPNSMHATVILAANGTSQFQRRITNGGATTNSDAAGQGSPCWVKINRTGNIFTAQHSKDGVNWVSFETDPNTPTAATIAMSNQVYIGIAVTSHTANVLAAATLSNISTTGTVSAGAWTVAAIGDTDQAQGSNTIDALYVGIEDSTGKSAKVYAPANAVGSGAWVEWLVPYSQFTGVNMTKVRKLSIGVGNSAAPAKGKGLILIDNISYGHTLAE